MSELAAARSVRASAPGKVMLCGEYAVLRGAPALLVAVDRRVEVTVQYAPQWSAWSDLEPRQHWSGAGPPGRPVSALLAELAGLDWHEAPLAVQARSVALRDGQTKLGLGSSAAIAVAAMAALGALANRDGALAEVIAFHDRLQGRPGSGADVACSFRGGWVCFQSRASLPVVRPLAVTGPAIAFIWTGVAASTVDFIVGFEHWAARPGSAALLGELQRAAQRAADCWAQGARAALKALDEFADLTADLGKAAKLPVHGGPHGPLRELGRHCGVVYKPCGAGGGDFGVALAADPAALDEFAARVEAYGCRRLPLAVDRCGVTVEILPCGESP